MRRSLWWAGLFAAGCASGGADVGKDTDPAVGGDTDTVGTDDTDVSADTDVGGGDDTDVASDFVDADGDGVSAPYDCNDADETIHPGAVEVYYDSVDQDCDGSDDDQDGDGYPLAADCVDTDPTIHPGAGEIPGDSVDQNCDGTDAATEFTDLDGDGYPAIADCNDNNPLVNPGAAEVWYDGLDQDCDGRDDDRDGDGVGHLADCDDQDALVFPGQDEIAGDNVDQDCDGSDPKSVAQLHAGDLVIDEVMVSPLVVSDAYGEWFEVYNATGRQVDLGGLEVAGAVNGLSFTVVGPLIVDAGGVVVFGRERTTSANGGASVDYEYRSDFSLPADAESLSLSNGSVVLDEVAYDTAAFFPADVGASMSLDARFRTGAQNDEGQYWCASVSAMSGGDAGTPGRANDACPGMSDGDGDGWVSAWDCADSNGAIHPLAAEVARDHQDQDCDGADFDATALNSGELVISEIMYNPSAVADADGEWFEVYNPTSYTLNLRGLVASDDAAFVDYWTVTTDLVVAPQSYHVFAVDGNATRNGGVTGAYDYPGTSFNLNNSADDIYLLRRNGGGFTQIDAVIWDELSGWPAGTGASIQLRPNSLNATSNDQSASWCLPVAHIANDAANDLGTPGRPNGC